jgi:hypothetical protein
MHSLLVALSPCPNSYPEAIGVKTVAMSGETRLEVVPQLKGCWHTTHRA